MKSKTVREMKIEELAARIALDFFSRSPKYRTREQLRLDVEAAIRTASTKDGTE